MTDTIRPSGGASSELRRTVRWWDTDIPLLSADPFNLDARLVIGGQEYIRCTGRTDYTLTGCTRGVSREEGGSEAKTWPGGTSVDQVSWSTTEVVTVYPTTPTLAMVGRDFAWDAGDGNVYRYHVVLIEGSPVVVWDDEPPDAAGALAFLWASQITGLTSISGVALDASANIYASFVAAGAGTLRKYNSSLVSQWSTALNGQHVATDGTTTLATDPRLGFRTIYKRLASTGANGSPSSFGTGGTGNGQFGTGGPVGIAFDGTNVWAVDPGNTRVQKFTASTGAYVSQFDGSSSGLVFSAPTGIAIGPTSAHLYVLDAPHGRVVKFDKTTHAFTATFTLGNGTADGQISTTAEGIAVDSTGRIWIADTGNHRIQVFDSAGVFLGKVGSFGSGSGELKSPKQLAFDSAGTIAYVADSGNNRLVTVQEKPPGIFPVITERSGSGVSVSANASGSATATCNAGEVSIGGGFDTGTTNNMFPLQSRRSGTTGWTITIRNNSGGSQTLTPYVMCLQVPIV
jgi:hypothetical protein